MIVWRIICASAILLAGFQAEADPAVWKPDARIVARLDAKVLRLPLLDKRIRVRSYFRYYLGADSNGQHVIYGSLLEPMLQKNFDHFVVRPKSVSGLSQVYAVSEARLLPAYVDTGCGDIYLTYDVANDKIVENACAGIFPPRFGGPPPWPKFIRPLQAPVSTPSER